MSVAAIAERSDRPAYVRFKRVSVENRAESQAQGRYVGKDVDYALITPPYSRDVVEIKAEHWFANLEQDMRNERIPKAWVDMYKEAYAAWKRGEELPVHGEPIKAWPVLSPTQREMLLRLNILTVEDLAKCNDEGLKRIGMGAVELKNKAVAWLKSAAERGPLTQENAALKREIEVLKGERDTLIAQVETLKTRLSSFEIMANVNVQRAAEPAEAISASDLLDSDEPMAPRRAKGGR